MWKYIRKSFDIFLFVKQDHQYKSRCTHCFFRDKCYLLHSRLTKNVADIHEGHTKPILSLFFGLSRFKQTHKQALKISAGFTIAPNALSPGTVPSISSSSSSLTTSNEKMVAADLLSPPTEIQSRSIFLCCLHLLDKHRTDLSPLNVIA